MRSPVGCCRQRQAVPGGSSTAGRLRSAAALPSPCAALRSLSAAHCPNRCDLRPHCALPLTRSQQHVADPRCTSPTLLQKKPGRGRWQQIPATRSRQRRCSRQGTHAAAAAHPRPLLRAAQAAGQPMLACEPVMSAAQLRDSLCLHPWVWIVSAGHSHARTKTGSGGGPCPSLLPLLYLFAPRPNPWRSSSSKQLHTRCLDVLAGLPWLHVGLGAKRRAAPRAHLEGSNNLSPPCCPPARGAVSGPCKCKFGCAQPGRKASLQLLPLLWQCAAGLQRPAAPPSQAPALPSPGHQQAVGGRVCSKSAAAVPSAQSAALSPNRANSDPPFLTLQDWVLATRSTALPHPRPPPNPKGKSH
jgi:hypothetical protein